MIRGAQSGGVVAYDFNNISKQTNGEDKAYHPRKVSSKAIRSRLVNKKRTDLSQLLRVKVQRDLRRAMLFDSDRFIPRILAGHTLDLQQVQLQHWIGQWIRLALL